MTRGGEYVSIRRLTLRTQLSLFASGLVVLTVLLTAGLQLALETRGQDQARDRRLSELASGLLPQARAAAAEGRLGDLEAPARDLIESTEAVYVWVLDSGGRVRYERPFDSATHGAAERSMNAVLDALKAGEASALRDWNATPVAERVYSLGGTGMALVVGFDRAESARRSAASLAGLRRRLLGLSASALAVGLLGAALFARRMTKTLDKLAAGAQRIGEGHLSARVLTTRADELGALSSEFNAMGKKLQELEELKDAFLAKITHDLRSPLSAVVGYAGLLEMQTEGPLTEKQVRSAKLIIESAGYLSELIDNILDLTKMEAGRMPFSPVPADLAGLAKTVVEQLAVKAAEYGVRLDASGIPAGARVYADEQALRRVLVNLVSNSLKFTPTGGAVRLEWSRTAEGFDRVGVRDSGIGIPPERIASLFNKFTQVPETANVVRPVRGTGLGLAICKEIVEAHGGRIWVESVYQKGSVFHFTLPPVPR